MKGKLIKREKGYILIDINKSNEDRWSVIGSYPINKDVEKLSLKNCQAIELGYDLDELLDNITPKNGTIGNISERIGFVKGFKKALELIGNNKFSDEDIRKAVEIARNGSMQQQHNGYGRPTELRFVLDNVPSDDIIQSLQQTEWDVKIEFEINHEISNGFTECFTDFKPKLDSEGCLILRRI